MQNKITIDMMRECGCDCECIISEANGSNTVELYMWSVTGNPSIEIFWKDKGIYPTDDDDSRYDINGDGEINEADMQELLEAFAANEYDEKYDINGDGYLSTTDLKLLADKYEEESSSESGTEIAEGIFLDNGDYYYSIPLRLIKENHGIAIKIIDDGFESKTIYFNCVNIGDKTDFIVTRNLSFDDTYVIAAAADDSLPVASATEVGGVKVGNGLAIAQDGTLSVNYAQVNDVYATSIKFNSTGFILKFKDRNNASHSNTFTITEDESGRITKINNTTAERSIDISYE